MSTRPPELDAAARAMVQANADFVLVGGFAVIANRFVRATEDIDLLVPDDPDNTVDPSGLLGLPSLQDVANYASGIYDDWTFGATRAIRQALGSDSVDYCSTAYTTGQTTGLAASFAFPGGGLRAAAKAPRLLGPGTSIGSHVAPQMAKRGWTERLIDSMIARPARTVATRDTRRMRGGGRMDDPATAYYGQRGGYVVRNDAPAMSSRCPIAPTRIGSHHGTDRRASRWCRHPGASVGQPRTDSLVRAARLLDECATAGVRVLGLEGFRLADGETRPDMSAIADLSDVEDPAASVEEARAVVSEIEGPDLMLEFTLVSVAT